MYTFLELGFDRSVFTILSTEMIQKLNQVRQIAPQFNIDLSHNNNFKKKKKKKILRKLSFSEDHRS